MSASPVDLIERRMWSPDPVRQRLASYTVEDVLALPGDSPRVELRDGVMIELPGPTPAHQDIVFHLWTGLREQAPGGFRVIGGLGIGVDFRQAFEPDVLVFRGEMSGTSHYVMADQVVVAVEVVSPGTERRDRIEKPANYADAGIAQYWRVEQDPVHVYAYELGPDGAYKLMADSDTELVLERPFPIRLAIADITP